MALRTLWDAIERQNGHPRVLEEQNPHITHGVNRMASSSGGDIDHVAHIVEIGLRGDRLHGGAILTSVVRGDRECRIDTFVHCLVLKS